DRGALVYLLASPAVAPFIGVVLVGLLLAWHGTLVPPRRLAASGVGAPTLDTFVDALAGLYARTRDWPRVAARYRELTAARLRRPQPHRRCPGRCEDPARADPRGGRLGTLRPGPVHARSHAERYHRHQHPRHACRR